WYNFLGFALLPWVALGVRHAMEGRRLGVVLTAAGLAWMIGFGGTYTAPFTALVCIFEVIDGFISRPCVRAAPVRALKMAALSFALAIGLSAVRLWPVMQTLQMAPRIVGGAGGIAPKDILPALVGRIHPGATGDFPIEGDYLVGAWCFVAVAAGLARKKILPLALVGLSTIWLAQGYGPSISLFAALKLLPFYSTLRYPERFLVLLALSASVVAALGITRLAAFARERVVGAALAAVTSALLVCNLYPLMANHWAVSEGRPMGPSPAVVDRPFQQARGTRWGLAYYGPMSRGSLSCYDAYPVPQSPLLRGDLAADEYLEDASIGTVTRTRWTPNAIDLRAELTQPGRVLVNQNWHPGWRSSEGAVENDNGLLAVALPAGKHDFVVRFLPRAAVGGAAISLATLGVLLWLARRRRAPPPQPSTLHQRRRGGSMSPLEDREYLVAIGIPLVPLVLTLAVMHEPPVPPSQWKTPSGENIVADAPPQDAQRIDAQFAGGVTLEAFKISSLDPAPESVVTFEFDWKVLPDVAPNMGFFVHIVPSSGKDLRADHVMVSDVLEIEKAPPGKTLRDVVEMTIPYDASKKTWTVYAGLWRVRGDGKRIDVVRPGTVKVGDNRLELGTFTVP
ncbi:MAG TPA: hypothetical protein VNO21_23090, partial [Polyangiaceae bacterium]|nr:hypothetical protein [Polyangiaceae bacterium]